MSDGGLEQLLAFCRPGFETEAGRELMDVAGEAGVFGYFEPVRDRGLVMFSLPGPETASVLLARVSVHQLVFVRDWLVVVAPLALPAQDRVGAAIATVRDVSAALPRCARVEVRLPENNADRDLGNFARKWVAPLSRALRDNGLLAPVDADADGRLEVVLTGFEGGWLGYSLAANRSRDVNGIPRLRLSSSAPSRSAMKLEEAWKVFLPPEQSLDYLGGGKHAADLGAAPGGWTWQLVRQGMTVYAVDNGPMNEALMASGQVEHVRADGYTWRPRRAIDWMVCDIVDQPRRTVSLVTEWFAAGLCRYCVFNLKLPMKKRYEEWLVCRERLEQGLLDAGVPFRLQASHLYHDREEITCFIERRDS